MKLPIKERAFPSIVVVGLAVVLVALAILQYHWSSEVSRATSDRLKANLNSSMFTWREDLNRELTSVLTALQTNPMLALRDKTAQYAQQYQTWSQTAAHANLVSHIFVLDEAGTARAQLLQLNTTSNQFESVEWPADLANLHIWIEGHSTEFVNLARKPGQMRAMHSHDGGHPGGPMGGGNRHLFGPDVVTMDLNAMALIRPQHGMGAPPSGPSISWLIVTLDKKVLEEHILPELTERDFSGSEPNDYEVAVVTSPGSALIYSSDAGFGKQDSAPMDATLPVFGLPRGSGISKGITLSPFGPAQRGQSGGRHERREQGFAGPVRIAVLPAEGAGADWLLLVRNRKGSLEAVVAGVRRRNLALSFGVLLVLSAGIAILLISSQRARVLAKLQVDFVAAVSHELRTPLAVISSAAENIADGVVAGKQQLSQYGTEIKSQAKQLMQLVEQILLFAATRDKRHHYNLRPLRIMDVVEAALKDIAGLIDSAGIRVEQDIAPSLPPIVGDLSALSHCLQNLITNAVKYGGDARWIGIKAKVREDEGRFDEVQLSVEDKGLGISPGDLRRIFEPFYRSREVAAAQIHGTGLGLSLARDIAEAMGGRLTVSSEPGKGSCFTVHLPFANVTQLQSSLQASAAVNPKLSKT